MKAYKILDTKYDGHKRHIGRIMVQTNISTISDWSISGTPDKVALHCYAHPLKCTFTVEEIDLLKEKWIHPHLPKNVKKQVQDLLKSA